VNEREMYDRLLELAGECRHAWDHGRKESICVLCRYALWTPGVRAEDQELPVFGDGRKMSLGEMVRLWNRLGGSLATVSLSWDYRVDRAFPEAIHSAKVERQLRPSSRRQAEKRQGDTPELALAAAIIAAMDGAK